MSRYVSPVIPVLDLMIGQIVWAKGGNRGSYSPVCSPLTLTANPVEVAKAVFNQTGCDCLYVANIDSFAGASPISPLYDELVEAGFSLWIDADWMGSLSDEKRSEQISKLAHRSDIRLIFSSETMTSLNEFSIIEELVQGGLAPIFSLDMRKGKVITKSEQMTDAVAPMDMISAAWDCGIRDMILLDLESVGTYSGVSTVGIVEKVIAAYPEARLISGGGIRDQADAQRLLSAGCENVLVASAIFDCRYTPDDIASLTPFRPCPLIASAMKMPIDGTHRDLNPSRHA